MARKLCRGFALARSVAAKRAKLIPRDERQSISKLSITYNPPTGGLARAHEDLLKRWPTGRKLLGNRWLTRFFVTPGKPLVWTENPGAGGSILPLFTLENSSESLPFRGWVFYVPSPPATYLAYLARMASFGSIRIHLAPVRPRTRVSDANVIFKARGEYGQPSTHGLTHRPRASRRTHASRIVSSNFACSRVCSMRHATLECGFDLSTSVGMKSARQVSAGKVPTGKGVDKSKIADPRRSGGVAQLVRAAES